MQNQSSLGGSVINRLPNYYHTQIGRVTSIKDYEKFGRIEVIFIDYSQPVPVWVFNNIDREPVEGDRVLVGFMEGRKDAPYVVGFLKNSSYTTNFITVKRDTIKLQLPVFEIGVKDGKSHKDVQENLLDDAKQKERAYLEISPSEVLISFPTSADGATPPATIKITGSEVKIDHHGAIKHHGGSKGVARIGDTVQVSGTTSDGATFSGSGTITTGSSKTLID